MQSPAAGPPQSMCIESGNAQHLLLIYCWLHSYSWYCSRRCSCCPLRCTVCIALLQCVSILSLSFCSLNIHVVCNVKWVPASVFCLCTVGDCDEEVSFPLNRRPSLVSFWRRISAQFDPVAVVISIFLFFIVLFVFAVVET